MLELVAVPLTKEDFAPFGDVIEFAGKPDFAINNGMCDRYHALAEVETIGEGPRPIISLGYGRHYQMPLTLELMERHPLGSQAFIPLEDKPFLVIVAPDNDGAPGMPQAFLTEKGQGVNYHRNTWHSVLTPLKSPTKFLIVDRSGDGDNLEEHIFDKPYMVKLP